MIVKKFTFILIAFFSTLLSNDQLFAQQNFELASLAGQFSPNNSYETGSGKAHIIDGIANLKLPVKLAKDRIWFNQVTYLHSEVQQLEKSGNGSDESLKLQGVLLKTGLIQPLKNDRALLLFFTPRLMYGSSSSSPDFQTGVTALYQKRVNQNLLLRYGLLYNGDLFGTMLIPLFQINYHKPESRWTFSGLLPIKSKIDYRFTDQWHAGFQHLGLITSYPAQVSDRAHYIERKSIDLSLYLNRRISNHLIFELRGGYSLGRSFSLYQQGDDLDLRIAAAEIGPERNQLNTNIEDGFFAGVKLSYNLTVE